LECSSIYNLLAWTSSKAPLCTLFDEHILHLYIEWFECLGRTPILSSCRVLLNNFDRLLALLNCCRVLLFFRSSLLYIEVWEWTLSCQRIQKRVVWSFDQSPMIHCLICLLFNEGSISNAFHIWRNIVTDRAVILVL